MHGNYDVIMTLAICKWAFDALASWLWVRFVTFNCSCASRWVTSVGPPPPDPCPKWAWPVVGHLGCTLTAAKRAKSSGSTHHKPLKVSSLKCSANWTRSGPNLMHLMSKFTKHLSTITEQFKLNELFLTFFLSCPKLFIRPGQTQTTLMRQINGKKDLKTKKNIK